MSICWGWWSIWYTVRGDLSSGVNSTCSAAAAKAGLLCQDPRALERMRDSRADADSAHQRQRPLRAKIATSALSKNQVTWWMNGWDSDVHTESSFVFRGPSGLCWWWTGRRATPGRKPRTLSMPDYTTNHWRPFHRRGKGSNEKTIELSPGPEFIRFHMQNISLP